MICIRKSASFRWCCPVGFFKSGPSACTGMVYQACAYLRFHEKPYMEGTRALRLRQTAFQLLRSTFVHACRDSLETHTDTYDCIKMIITHTWFYLKSYIVVHIKAQHVYKNMVCIRKSDVLCVVWSFWCNHRYRHVFLVNPCMHVQKCFSGAEKPLAAVSALQCRPYTVSGETLYKSTHLTSLKRAVSPRFHETW